MQLCVTSLVAMAFAMQPLRLPNRAGGVAPLRATGGFTPPRANARQAAASSENSRKRQAVERLVTAELMGLASTLRKGGKPMWIIEGVREWAVTRGPIIHWAIDSYVRAELQADDPHFWSTELREAGFFPWQVFRPKSVGWSLRMLRPQLRLQVAQGFWSAPFRTCRLLASGARVWMFAMFPPVIRRRFMPREWPRCLEHLAMTLERNQEREMGRVRFARIQTLMRDYGVPGMIDR